jgi:hypothetical protein
VDKSEAVEGSEDLYPTRQWLWSVTKEFGV